MKLEKKYLDYIEIFQKSAGNISEACRNYGISRMTHYEWYKTIPEFKEAIDAVKESWIDFCETQLYKLAKGIVLNDTRRVQVMNSKGNVIRSITTTHDQQQPPNPTALIFILKTLGKSRGFIDTVYINNTDKEHVFGVLPKNEEQINKYQDLLLEFTTKSPDDVSKN